MKGVKVKTGDWNLSLLYSGDADEKIMKDVEAAGRTTKAFVKKWKETTGYLTDLSVLKTALDEYEKLLSEYGLTGEAGYYWGLRESQDEDNPEIKAQINKLNEISVRRLNELEFFELRIAKIKTSFQKKVLAAPLLMEYRHFLERLFQTAKFNLSEPEEKIVNIMEKTSHDNWVGMTSRFLAKEERTVIDENGKKCKANLSRMLDLLNSPKKNVRDTAAVEVHEINEKYADVAESEMNSILENKRNEDTLRSYSRPDEAQHISGDIDSDVVDSMISAVSSNFKLCHRYYTLKAKLLGLPRLAYHERNVRYGNISRKYTFSEAMQVVRTSMRKLDRECVAILDQFYTHGQYDVFPRKNKSGGAFCAHYLKGSPVYILLNFSGNYDEILTIAHETGHGINDELMRKSQNALNFHSPLSIAEVASTFFEDFALKELLTGADEEMKRAVLMQKLNDDMSTIFRQISAYRFEQELHEKFRKKGYVPKNEIGMIFQKHMSAYMGPAVSQDPGSENWWVYWSHFRRFFYVYSYASGLLISKTLQAMVAKDSGSMVLVKRILSAGTSMSPKELFAEVGIDLTNKAFWVDGVAETGTLLTQIGSGMI